MDYIKGNLSKEFEDVNNTLNSLNSQMNESFKDEIITEMELKNIQNLILQIDKEYLDINKIYNEIYNNDNLKG